MDLVDLGQKTETSCCSEQDKEQSDPIRGEEFLDQLSNCKLYNKDYDSQSFVTVTDSYKIVPVPKHRTMKRYG
jgi:hypothetical protein